ncbi:hypothetical protein ACEN2T_17780 [Pseudomonas sp. W22_MBD1_FP4]|uniref:hypothetical protein n=1 Tax=Pseudomonas sp. W22_MBD1_FP4 TaxID=3240272 RepID=UPI003F9C1429
MSDLQVWFFEQSYSFQAGFQDYRGGELFSGDRNEEWRRGWKWANANNVSRSC